MRWLLLGMSRRRPMWPDRRRALRMRAGGQERWRAPIPWRGVWIGGTLLLLVGTAAFAENFDAGKSGARLFADSCASCHRSPRGLAKGRFRLTLYLFLQQHYTSGSDTASALASYLQSVEEPPAAHGTTPRRTKGRSDRPPRPPRPVTGH